MAFSKLDKPPQSSSSSTWPTPTEPGGYAMHSSQAPYFPSVVRRTTRQESIPVYHPRPEALRQAQFGSARSYSIPDVPETSVSPSTIDREGARVPGIASASSRGAPHGPESDISGSRTGFTPSNRTGLTPIAARESLARPEGHEYVSIQTEHGPVSILADVKAASKFADEKRKRNAGASARFRARRKEREQASTKEATDLRQTMDSLAEEVDFYRRERDYFASVVFYGPERDRHFPRPPSPRRRQGSQSSGGLGPPPAAFTPGNPSFEERGAREDDGRYARRRLTADDQPGASAFPGATMVNPQLPYSSAYEPLPTTRGPARDARSQGEHGGS